MDLDWIGLGISIFSGLWIGLDYKIDLSCISYKHLFAKFSIPMVLICMKWIRLYEWMEYESSYSIAPFHTPLYEMEYEMDWIDPMDS